MAIQTLETLKNWFKRGAKPTAQQFSDVFDSFVHKNEMIPQNKIEELSDTLTELQTNVNSAFAGAIEDVKVNGVSLQKNDKGVNIEIKPSDLADNGEDCLRINILKVLDIGTAGNKIVIDIPEGYIGYVQTGESIGCLKYCSYVNGYNSIFNSYTANLNLETTTWGQWTENNELVSGEKMSTNTQTVYMSYTGTSLSLPISDAFALKGGTQIVIEVDTTTFPATYLEDHEGKVLPKILIWGTIFCYRREME
ncbi:MAG: hypothetical protein J6Y55_11010 [Bacteroidales bacterium]|nr:hypothetical protein [Bacteroidales bacterium]